MSKVVQLSTAIICEISKKLGIKFENLIYGCTPNGCVYNLRDLSSNKEYSIAVRSTDDGYLYGYLYDCQTKERFDLLTFLMDRVICNVQRA